MYLIKSKIRLLYDILKDKIHFIVLSLIIAALADKYWVLIFLLVLYLIYILIYNKSLFIVNLIILLFITFMFVLKEINYQKPFNFNQLVKVVKVERSNEKYLIKVKIDNKYLLLKTNEPYQVGMKVLVQGELEKYDIHYPKGFDYQEYLHYQNIVGVINNPTIKEIKKSFSIHSFNYFLNHYIEKHFNNKTSKYLKTLTIGNDDLLDTTNISKIGISHLFVISGLHMNIIVLILDKLLSLLKVKSNTRKIIVLVFTFIYIFITDFMISIMRVWLTLFLKFLFKNKLSNIDIISINMILVLILNPFYIYQLSFILTYLISFFMLIYQDVIHLKNRFLNKLLNIFCLTLIIQFLTLPITISINPDFNLVSVLVNPFFIYFVSYLFLPFSFLTFFIPYLEVVYQYLVVIFEYLVDFSSNIEFLSIPLGNINIYFKVIYYLFFYYILASIYQKKYYYLISMILILTIWYYKGFFNLNDKIYFLDLPYGEATLIVSKNNQEVILVDTGEQTKNNELTKILKDLGIRKIDYLIITHSDTDHLGGSFDLMKWIKIKNLILNIYDKNQKTEILSKKVSNTYYLKKNNQIKEKYFQLDVLSPTKNYKDVNDNSLVFILEVFKIKILFTGDISVKVEKEIIKNYNIDVDFYKVAHHGSLTSSSEIFINNIKFRYAVIMSGYYNQFGFPKEEVVKRFNPKQLLRTDKFATIIIKAKKNKYDLIYLKK